MGELLPDPELERLAQELDHFADGQKGLSPAPDLAAVLDAAHTEEVGEGEPLERLLAEMVRLEATDLVLIPGAPPMLRVSGRLRPGGREPVEPGQVEELLASHLGPRARRQLESAGSADFSLRLESSLQPEGGWRMRVNLMRARAGLSAAFRALPRRVPTLAELNLPETLASLVAPEHGLVLICGPTGCGKSSTLAALVGLVNRERCRHIVTIEDPVEYEHSNRSSVVEQVEIGRDAPDFASALRAALRRDPDVILVGEMRDLETMAIALTAAETGHLLLSTLHTRDTAQAVHRVVDGFPSEQQEQIRQQLALSLSAIVCQQLVARSDGCGRVPAVEVLLATYAVRNHIRKGTTHQLYNELLVGRGQGMVALEESLAALLRRGVITPEEARARAVRLDELERRLQGAGP
jgi:twitching motility protein PilT